MLVCKYTGVEHGPHDTSNLFDLNGGNYEKKHRNLHSGAGCHKRKKQDQITASILAYNASSQFTDTDVVAYSDHNSSNCGMKHVKNGRTALCVGQSAVIFSKSNRRDRFGKQNVQSNQIRATLRKEAEFVINKLLNYKTCELSFEDALKKHIHSCKMCGSPIDFDTMHNIWLAYNKNKRDDNDSSAVKTIKFQTHCVSLVLALWIAICGTPYFLNSEQGEHSYRSFVCGVLYATKRGVQLSDGTYVIPKCVALASVLPTLRQTTADSVAKTLKLSNSRGIRTIIHSIASVQKDCQHTQFADSIKLASCFQTTKFSPRDI